jgi:hypothetical protein
MIQNKIFPNPNRKRQVIHTPYQPEYRRWGVEPIQAPNSNPFNIKGKALVIDSNKNTSKWTPKAVARDNVPYASPPTNYVSNVPVPNVGNNVENIWSSIDNTVVDDIGLEENTQMVDNNDFYPEYAMGGSVEAVMTEPTMPQSQDGINLQTNEYLIAIDGQIISTGSLEAVQDEIRQLVFGEHPLSIEAAVDVNDIIVLKRVNIKMGVFLDE